VEQRSIIRTTRRMVLAVIAAAPLAAQAQQRDPMRRIGVLMGGPNAAGSQANAAALVQALGALNWREGGNLRIDWRFPGADAADFDRSAAELVALNPEVLVTVGMPEIKALQRQTRTIPIVFAGGGDPVGRGVAESLAHPGGNVTGFSSEDPPIAGRWLQLLTQISPPATHVAVLYNPGLANYVSYLPVIEKAAGSLAVTVRAAPVRDDAEIEATMAGLASEQHDGIMVLPDPLTIAHHDAIVAMAARHRLPTVCPFGLFAAAGGLMSYGADASDLFRRSADYVDRILKGAKPGDLPIQNPTKFELVINLKTAKAIGVTMPLILQMTADAVIE